MLLNVFQKITSELEVKLGKEARAIDVTQIEDPDLLRDLSHVTSANSLNTLSPCH